MPAAMALIDEEQVDALHELFGATTELACRLVDKLCEYYPELTEINVHDDWGAQKAPFFSMDVANELFVPYMKKLTDHIHAKGRIATLHSCGHNADRIQCYIDGGFDQWSPQPMNDIEKLYELYGDKIVPWSLAQGGEMGRTLRREAAPEGQSFRRAVFQAR